MKLKTLNKYLEYCKVVGVLVFLLVLAFVTVKLSIEAVNAPSYTINPVIVKEVKTDEIRKMFGVIENLGNHCYINFAYDNLYRTRPYALYVGDSCGGDQRIIRFDSLDSAMQYLYNIKVESN